MDPATLVCLANPEVVSYVRDATIAATVPVVAKQVIDAYGGPGVLLGTAWPVILLTLAITTWRTYHVRSVRAWLLLFAVLINMTNGVNATMLRIIPPSELHLPTHLIMACVLSNYKMAFVASAGAWRFGQVFAVESRKKLVIWGLTAFFMAWATALSILGCVEINRNQRVSKTYWGLVVGIAVVYIIAGALTFTRVLQKMENEFKIISPRKVKSTASSQAPLSITYLRISNNIAIGVTLLCAFLAIVVSQAFDSVANPYVLSGTLLITSTWNLAEAMFEVFTIFQQAAPSGPSTPSATGPSVTGPSVTA
ncbi:hypothetical protein HDU85_003429 [Gaertneriomyces sp. JEL0708]|nr:hypothetical protein HDU85_003429 [Gaertneriomyces sp. JEL0708]